MGDLLRRSQLGLVLGGVRRVPGELVIIKRQIPHMPLLIRATDYIQRR
jgi:hypothetical protein